MQEFDTIIIGGGPGGYHAAALAAAKGERVALIERDKLGGTCLNRGCIPTKCLCASARVADDARHAADYGIELSFQGIDYGKVVARRDAVVNELRRGVEELLGKVEIVRGDARMLAEERTVEVNGTVMTAKRLIIATGSKPARLRCEGADKAIDSDEFLNLDALPESAIIIGAGVIGLEFASVLRSFGCEVTVLEYAPEILAGSNADPDIAKRLRMLLKRRGIDIICGAEVTAISDDKTVSYRTRKGEKTCSAEMVLAAVGRRPVMPEGIADAGIALTQRGFIEVDSSLATSVPGVYAIGDVNGLCMLAHAATAQAECVLNGHCYSPANTPAVVFTEPECASVGACDGPDYLCATLPVASNGKCLADGHSDGIVKLVVTADDKKIAGVHAVGPHAADLIAEAAIAIQAGMTAADLAATVHAHPSVSELLQEICSNFS